MTTLPLLRVPEFIIHDGLQKALQFLRQDFLSVGSLTQNSFLFKLISSINLQKYNFLKESIAVFITDIGNPRHLEIDLMYNSQVNRVPSIHITTPADSPHQNGIGMDEGYQEELLNNTITPTSYQSVFTRRYTGVYDIVITSDNNNEVILIYHVVRALLTSLYFHFQAKGLENISISGQDLTPYQELIPKGSFQRAIRLKLEYESSTLSFETMNIPVSFEFDGTPVNEL